MKKYLCCLSSFLLILSFTGCGDNKTKQKLYGSQIVNSTTTSNQTSTTGGYSSTLAADSATIVSKMGAGVGVMHAPQLEIKSVVYRTVPTGMTGPDTSGFYSTTSGSSVVYVKFMDGAGATLTFDQVIGGALRSLEVKITTQYQYGAWAGDFLLTKAAPYSETSAETVTSGTITSSDPIGGNFTATIAAGMTMDYITLASGAHCGVPNSGSMTLSSTTGGYTGTMNYTTSGSDHLCTGTILVSTTTVATVSLKFDTTNANYFGTYTDAAGATHSISPQ